MSRKISELEESLRQTTEAMLTMRTQAWRPHQHHVMAALHPILQNGQTWNRNLTDLESFLNYLKRLH